MKTYNIDGMTLRIHPVYPTDISIPKVIKILLGLLAVATLIQMVFAGEQILSLAHASNTAVFAGLLAWN